LEFSEFEEVNLSVDGDGKSDFVTCP
jgi:hypothetical protein